MLRLIFQKVTVFFLGKTKLSLICIFRALSKKTSEDDNASGVEEEVAEEQSRAKTTTLFELYKCRWDESTFNGKVISYLLSQRSVISPTCTLFHP